MSGGAAKQSQLMVSVEQHWNYMHLCAILFCVMVDLLQVEKPARFGAPSQYNRYGQEQFGAPGEVWCESISQTSFSLQLLVNFKLTPLVLTME